MKLFITYLKLEMKQMHRSIPILLGGMFLFVCISVGISIMGINVIEKSTENFDTINIALSADPDDKYTSLIVNTLASFDSVKMSFCFDYCSTEELEKGLKSGKYAAGFIIPEGYAQAFSHGENKIVEIRCGTNQAHIIEYVMGKLTTVASQLVLRTEQNIYAMQNYFWQKDLDGEPEALLNLNMVFVNEVLSRNNMFNEDHVDATDGVPISLYYLCDIISILFLFLGLQCSKIMGAKDKELYKKMRVHGLKYSNQVIASFLSLLSSFLIIYLIISIPIIIFGLNIDVALSSLILGCLLSTVVLLPACALIQFVFEIFDNVAYSVMGLFLIIAVFGFIAGNFYPVSFLPTTIQNLSVFTVTGAMFNYCLSCFTGSFSVTNFIMILCYTGLFIILTTYVRKKKLEV